MHDNRTAYNDVPHTWTAEGEYRDRDPYDTPARTPSGLTAFSQGETHGHMPASQELPLPMPDPTFGPGDLHVGKSTRGVNNGFEVLPAGTLGLPPPEFGFGGPGGSTDLGSVEETGQQGGGNRLQKGANRLKKRSNSQLQ